MHIKTKAEKKAAKKERQKELKKQPKHSAPNEATPTAATTPIVEATPIEESTSKSTIVSEAKNTEGDSIIEASVDVKQVAEVVEEEGDIDEDKKSKKKKKKKTGPAAEDDKKAAKVNINNIKCQMNIVTDYTSVVNVLLIFFSPKK